jgi:ABC-2 type transport system ATP-binding protein
MAVLEIRNLVKRFDAVLAVDDLSFSVAEGEIFGFLGGNGAGKTTTLRMVLDIIRPTAGTITVLGASPDRRAASAIGFLPEERGLYSGMSAIDTIVYFGRLKGLSDALARSRGLDLLERFDLADRAKSQIGDMSKGMAQKVQLATALVNEPELLMLDEPFSGLDPVNQQVLEELIVSLRGEGKTVLFSTHVMQHAERLCDRLLLIAKGKRVFEGTLADARGQLPRVVKLRSAAGRETLEGLPGIETAVATGPRSVEVTLANGARPDALLRACFERDITLEGFDIAEPSLHDIFVALIGPEARVADDRATA